ncbi:NlpC/P60 family protein [Arthrobacter sp. APC 3897]|uniref:NlpC/P60 family protein n=1 Tax=Arthrobacter sp. APC 3897 TaxID=3035204 RepID=UPI0025B53403|nr:NlpC/P60 family protein [Arthrobacter sp. APC 3897]MDN3481770.1 NlpC/P60 family protein [Arthrobacter sp. APC 3897]
MTSAIERARHRAPVERASTLTALAQAVSANAGTVGRQAAVVLAASGLVLGSGVAANATGSDVVRDVQTSTLDLAAAAQLTVPSTASVNFDRPAVAGVIKAPEAVEPEAAAQPETAVQSEAPLQIPAESEAVQSEATQPAAEQSPAAAPLQDAAPAGSVVQPAVSASPAPVTESAPAASGTAAIIAAAAYAQLGVSQDCTMLATNSLAAAGINFHDWPAGYLSLGSTVSASEAVPGDLIYYADGGMGMAHIAVYVGNGQAIHGGFNGNSTVIAPAELGSGGVYIRVR